MSIAPILVSVYDRLDCLKKCIECLKENALARNSILYIVSDNYKDQKDMNIINEVREYINTITGFKNVIPIFNKTNLRSSKHAVDMVFSEHKVIIRLEDDVLVSKYFLEYINEGLELYKDNQNILAICGYSPNKIVMPKEYNEDTYLWSKFAPWGYGMWKDRYERIDRNMTGFDKLIKDKRELKKFKSIHPNSVELLIMHKEGKIRAPDSVIGYHMYINKLYCVYPRLSLVKNIGFDGRGIRCGKNRYFMNEKYYNIKINHNPDIKPNKEIYKIRRKFNSWRSNIVMKNMIKLYKKIIRKKYL